MDLVTLSTVQLAGIILVALSSGILIGYYTPRDKENTK